MLHTAHAFAGDDDAARTYIEQAQEAAQGITDDEDKQLVLGDLDSIPLAD